MGGVWTLGNPARRATHLGSTQPAPLAIKVGFDRGRAVARRPAEVITTSYVFAQESSPDEDRLRKPDMRAALGLPRMTQDAPPVQPIRREELQPIQPGLTGGYDWLEGLAMRETEMPQASNLPEGIFLRGRKGTVWSGPNGLWIFLPDADSRLPGEGAMILAPNGVLDRLTASLESQPLPAAFELSGQTLLYHNHNYLLLTDYARVRPPSVEPASEEPRQGTEPSPEPSAEVADLIAQLQGASRAGERRSDALRDRLLTAERSQAESEGIQPVGTPPLVRDGTYISQRRARLVRLSGGEWALAFDNDADTLGDGPLVVIPGRTLMRMEARVGAAGSMPMTVSGRIYTSKGRGYVLPVLFSVAPSDGLQPMQ